MKMLDLFSGIGGFSLAAEWVWGDELDIVCFVENDPFCQKILKKHWPDTPIFGDIRNFNKPSDICYFGEQFKTDLITGGFPCQDISIAGKGVGIEGERSGLWTEYKRIISECRPKFALIENVSALTHRGLDRILYDLAEIGYNAEWQSISASEVGAWHKRERIWILSYPIDSTDRTDRGPIAKEEGIQGFNRAARRSGMFSGTGNEIPDTKQYAKGTSYGEEIDERRPNNQPYDRNSMGDEFRDSSQIVPDTELKRLQRCKEKENIIYDGEDSYKFPSRQSRNRFDYWTTEPNVGRVAHGIRNRVDRLKGLGNSIVPQVAYIIMLQIKRVIDELPR